MKSRNVNYLLNHASCLWKKNKNRTFLTLKDKKAAVKIIPCGWTAGRMEIYNFLCLCTRWSRSHPVLDCIAQQKTASSIQRPWAPRGQQAATDPLPTPHITALSLNSSINFLTVYQTPWLLKWLIYRNRGWLLSASFIVSGALDPNVFIPMCVKCFSKWDLCDNLSFKGLPVCLQWRLCVNCGPRWDKN